MEENRLILYMAERFARKGLRTIVFIAPKMISIIYQEDLGDSLYSMPSKARQDQRIRRMRKQSCTRAIDLLPRHCSCPEPTAWTSPTATRRQSSTATSILWDETTLSCSSKLRGWTFGRPAGGRLQKMADVLLRSGSATFMCRDFQSRNTS